MISCHMPIRYNSIEARSYVDGPGRRTVLFMQGCTLACRGCQNKHLWDKAGGRSDSVSDVAQTLATLSDHGNITISGGEPFQQPGALASLLTILKGGYKVAHTISYTGYTLEQLLSPDNPASIWMGTILKNLDVLVDGPFLHELDDPFITYRGSRNQRVIDVQATLQAGEIVELDWDMELAVLPNGSALMPAGMTALFAGIGPSASVRRCGERSIA